MQKVQKLIIYYCRYTFYDYYDYHHHHHLVLLEYIKEIKPLKQSVLMSTTTVHNLSREKNSPVGKFDSVETTQLLLRPTQAKKHKIKMHCSGYL